jgi:hypothetical protein
VPAEEVIEAAMAEAARLGELSTEAYAATKRNLRATMIEGILAELDADMATIDVPQL